MNLRIEGVIVALVLALKLLRRGSDEGQRVLVGGNLVPPKGKSSWYDPVSRGTGRQDERADLFVVLKQPLRLARSRVTAGGSSYRTQSARLVRDRIHSRAAS